jgi:hypothetical protein
MQRGDEIRDLYSIQIRYVPTGAAMSSTILRDTQPTESSRYRTFLVNDARINAKRLRKT